MVSFKREMTEEIETLDQGDREVICGALFCTVNWFREVCTTQITCICIVLICGSKGKVLCTFTNLHSFLGFFFIYIFYFFVVSVQYRV